MMNRNKNGTFQSQYTFNLDLFKTESKELYWILGLLASDGNINLTNNTINISQSNKSGLERLSFVRNLISSNNEIYTYNNVNILTICSKDLINILSRYNIVANKTLSFKLNDKYNVDYLPYFIQGYIEGDGCISISKNKANIKYLSINIVGTEELIKFLRQYIKIHYTTSQIKRCKNLYSITWNGRYAEDFAQVYFQEPIYINGKYQNVLKWNNTMTYRKKYDIIKSEIQKYIDNNKECNITEVVKRFNNLPFQTIYKWKNKGVIKFYKPQYKVVCMAFTKFFNAEEPNAVNDLSQIIANSHKGLIVTDKVDGSLIKVWYDNGWHVSTNGNIDANDSGLQCQTDILKTYYDLFLVAKENSNLDFNNLDPQYTYIFELISPYNRVVVRYTDTKLIHIGTRNNITNMEEEMGIGVEKPASYTFSNIYDVIEYAKTLEIKDDTNYEGFVVRDSAYHRVKVKSPRYLELHYLKGDGVYSTRKIIDIVLRNEQDEILAYFPEYTEDFNRVGEKLYKYETQLIDELINVAMPLLLSNADKKTYALAVKNLTNPSIMFNAYNDYYKDIEVSKTTWFEGQIKNMRLESLEQALERI